MRLAVVERAAILGGEVTDVEDRDTARSDTGLVDTETSLENNCLGHHPLRPF